jgi:archaetidylinositol phosphate synthase
MNIGFATIDKGAVFANAPRVNQALTASAEKRALKWMAERAPKWVSSDQLTVLGLCSQIAAGVFYGLSRYNRAALLLVILCIVLNWLGDSLDGTLARVRNQQRPRYGFYVDHMVDILGSAWSARLEMCQWIRETLDKESIWDEARSTGLSR